jgi:hypothetical protein
VGLEFLATSGLKAAKTEKSTMGGPRMVQGSTLCCVSLTLAYATNTYDKSVLNFLCNPLPPKLERQNVFKAAISPVSRRLERLGRVCAKIW